MTLKKGYCSSRPSDVVKSVNRKVGVGVCPAKRGLGGAVELGQTLPRRLPPRARCPVLLLERFRRASRRPRALAGREGPPVTRALRRLAVPVSDASRDTSLALPFDLLAAVGTGSESFAWLVYILLFCLSILSSPQKRKV